MAKFNGVLDRNAKTATVRVKKFKDGMRANLVIGMPVLETNYVDPSVEVTLQSENGNLGLGPCPKRAQDDFDLINAEKEAVNLFPGVACFGSDYRLG